MTTTPNVPQPRHAPGIEQAEHHSPMGDVLAFPGQPADSAPAAVHADAQRLDTDPGAQVAVTDDDQADTEPAAAPGTDLVPDTRNRQVTRVARGPVIPPALAGRAKQAAKAAVPVTKFTARHAYYLGGGMWDTASNTYSRWTGRDIDAQIAEAKAAGEHGVAADLMRQRIESKKLFLERIKVFGQFLVRLPIIIAGVSAVTLVLTLIASIVAWARPGGLTFTEVWEGLFTAVIDGAEWTAWAVTVPLPVLLITAITGVLIKGYNNRRRNQSAPSWVLATSGNTDGEGVLVTADGIVNALRNLQIPALRAAFKGGWVPRFELTPTREGEGAFKGYRVIFDTPDGVTAKMIADKKAVFARNLHRNDIEVWVGDYGTQRGGKAGFINLYVADSGVMDRPTPAYPLMHAGTADVFTGVPVGITQRGEPVVFVLVGSNFGFGGAPGQGKSNGMRVVMAGAALDPLAELWVHVFAMNGDFDAYAPRLARYTKGATPEHAAQATESLRELYDEVGRREGRLAELGAKKLTRAIAEKHQDMRPIIACFSECHELFGDAECGKEAAELATQVIKRGRKTGVVLGFDTQSSRADAIPPQVVENIGINGCFYVKSWRSNDGFLGDGSFSAGIRATDLRFNIDRGTMVVTGVTEELFEILRTYFIEVDDDTGWDAAAEIIERAMGTVAPGTRVDGQAALDAPKPRDLLEDLDEVLGTEPVYAADVPALLRDLAPDWSPYQRMNGKILREELAKLDIKVPTTGHKYPVDPVTVRSALARRATADLDDQE